MNKLKNIDINIKFRKNADEKIKMHFKQTFGKCIISLKNHSYEYTLYAVIHELLHAIVTFALFNKKYWKISENRTITTKANIKEEMFCMKESQKLRDKILRKIKDFEINIENGNV